MISTRKNIINIVIILLIVCILYMGYAYERINIFPEAYYNLSQEYGIGETTLEEYEQEAKEMVIYQLPGHLSIFVFAFFYYLFFNLSERWILKRNLNFGKKTLLVLLNIISIAGLVGAIFFTKYRMIKVNFDVSLFQQVISDATIWIEILTSIFWVVLLHFVATKERNIKSLALEKMYVYIRRIFIFVFILVELYFIMFVTNNYEKEINRRIIYEYGSIEQYNAATDLMIREYQLNENYVVQASVPIVVIGLAIVLIYIKTNQKLKDEIDHMNTEKELIIYASPWLMDISPYNTMGVLSKKRLINYERFGKNFTYIIEDEQYIFVDYRVIANNAIDLSEFNNIAYVFEYDAKCEKKCDKAYNEKFLQAIEECEKNNFKFIIVNHIADEDKKLLKKAHMLKEIKSKYSYAYFENISNWYEVVNALDRDFNKRIANIIDGLSENRASEYIKRTLENLHISSNYIEKFYTMLKILEYIIQYEALSYIAENKIYEKDEKFFKLPTLGYWASINKDEEIDIPKEKQINIINLLKELDINYSKNITVFTLKQAITEIHNRNLGHGTISYSVSKIYNELLLEIAEVLIPNFDSKNILLEKLKFVYKEKEEKMSIIKYELEYIYSGINHNAIEYFCFENGETEKLYENGGKEFILNLGEEHIA